MQKHKAAEFVRRLSQNLSSSRGRSRTAKLSVNPTDELQEGIRFGTAYGMRGRVRIPTTLMTFSLWLSWVWSQQVE